MHDSSHSLDDHYGTPAVGQTSGLFHSRNRLANKATDLGTNFDISRTVLEGALSCARRFNVWNHTDRWRMVAQDANTISAHLGRDIAFGVPLGAI